MIPVPLSAGAARPTPHSFKPWWLGYWAAIACFTLAGVGAIVWSAAASPFALQRFKAYDAEREQNLRQTDTYVVYQEYEGAGEASSPPPLEVKVREKYGTDVHVTMLQEPGQKSDVPAYRDPWHEGRAIAEFTITRPGPYIVVVQKLGSYDRTQFTGRTDADLAVGRRISSTWANSLLALGPLVALPALLGALLASGTRSRRRAARSGRSSPPGDATGTDRSPGTLQGDWSGPGSVLAHGTRVG